MTTDHLCICGHDLEDEHRVIEQSKSPKIRVYLESIKVRVCNECDVICENIGEREAYDAKVKEINARALPKVETAVKEYLRKA